MKIVILAAGEGTRMRPLTLETPKTLIKVLGKPVLDHIFESLPNEITEAVIVTRYLADKIRHHCGDEHYGRKITYVNGSEKGNAISFLSTKQYVIHEDRFLLIQGDELPYSEDIVECLSYESSSLCFEVDDPWNHGVVTVGVDGFIQEVNEKPIHPKTSIISNGVMVLTNRIFDYEPQIGKHGEYYFSSMFDQYVKNEKVRAVITKYGAGGFSSPEDIKKIESIILLRPK